jgi:hypothetical protein
MYSDVKFKPHREETILLLLLDLLSVDEAWSETRKISATFHNNASINRSFGRKKNAFYERTFYNLICRQLHACT